MRQPEQTLSVLSETDSEHGAIRFRYCALRLLLDGEATRACLILAAMCDGRAVLTIEGLRNDGTMEVLRRHFHECHALQCGFCTPGMLIAARDILRRIRRPDEPTVRHELSGHICRCTGYTGIVNAIIAAGQEIGGAGT